MNKSPEQKTRVVNYVSERERRKLAAAAKKAGLRTPSQIVGVWFRQKIA